LSHSDHHNVLIHSWKINVLLAVKAKKEKREKKKQLFQEQSSVQSYFFIPFSILKTLIFHPKGFFQNIKVQRNIT
jgi:hypothetical protein